MKEESRFQVGPGFFRTLEEAGRAAVTNPYVISPITLVLYEVTPMKVRAWVENREWHFEVKG